MKSFVRLLRRALISGSYASLASTVALLHGGVRDCRSAFAPVNAVSHWLWREKALRQHEATMRYSLSGYCIHHAASIFWAVAYEKLASMRDMPPRKAEAIATAAAVSAVACIVDMQCTPERLTPGFERRLSRPSLFLVYTAFGLGLALHAVLGDKSRH